MGQVIDIDQVTWNMLLIFKRNINFWSSNPMYQEAYSKAKDLYSERISSLVA